MGTISVSKPHYEDQVERDAQELSDWKIQQAEDAYYAKKDDETSQRLERREDEYDHDECVQDRQEMWANECDQ